MFFSFNSVVIFQEAFDVVLGKDSFLLPYIISLLSMFLVLLPVAFRLAHKQVALQCAGNLLSLLLTFSFVRYVTLDVFDQIARHNLQYPGFVYDQPNMYAIANFHLIIGMIFLVVFMVVAIFFRRERQYE